MKQTIQYILTTILGIIILFSACEEPTEPDSTPPVATIIEPINQSIVSGVVKIKVDAFDNDGISDVEFLIDEESVFTDSNEPYEYEWNTVEYAEDLNHTIFSIVTDKSDNIFQTQPISVFVDNQDNVSPIGLIVSPLAGQTVSGIVEITVEATDNDSVLSVSFFINGNLVEVDSIAPYTYSWNTTTAIEDTNHIISATISDISGNLTTLQSIIVFVDNSGEPDTTPPTAIITNPVAGQTVSGTITIEATASDNVGVAFINFYINGILVHTDFDSPYTYLWNTTTYAEDEDHIIGLTVTDVSGISSTVQPFSVFVNNEEEPSEPLPYPPTAINVVMVGDSISITWSGSASNNVHSYSIFKNNDYLTSVDSNATQYFDTDYSYNEEICYYLKAVTITGVESEPSQTACITTPNNPNIYDLMIEIWNAHSYENYLEIYDSSIDPQNLIYTSRDLTDHDIVIDYDTIPEGPNYIFRLRYDQTPWSYGPTTIFDVTTNIQVYISQVYSAPEVSEWNP